MMGVIKPVLTLGIAVSLLNTWIAPASAEPITVFTAELPPFVTRENGEVSGSLGEILLEMGQRADIELKFKFMPWKRSQVEVQNTPYALILAVGRNPTREAHYNWIVKTFVTNELFVSSGDPINSLEEAAALTSVTVLAGSPRARKLDEAGLTNVHVSRNTEIAAGLLMIGRADAWYTVDHRALYAIKSLGISTESITLGDPLHSIDVWIASNKVFDTQVATSLATALGDMRADGAYDTIIRKYTQ
jgi:polar amino acid transport system substrate-binding protein